MRIGVLAVQGAFREHARVLRRLGAEVVEVRLPEQLEGLDGLVIPGGESTAIMRLVRLYGLEEALRRFRGGIFGTCAGMILLDHGHLGLVDVEVERNAYGRQLASFEADLELAGDPEPLRGIFIRAPRVRRVGSGVQVLAEHAGDPVLVREGRFLLAAFHPELTDDTRVHERFLELVEEEQASRLPAAVGGSGAGLRPAGAVPGEGGEAPRFPGPPLARDASERRAGQYVGTAKRREGSILPPAAAGGGGAGLRPAGAVPGEGTEGQGGEDVGA